MFFIDAETQNAVIPAREWRLCGNTGANAKVAEITQKAQKGIPKLFENGLKQCLCGLQGINGLQGAWGLVVGGCLLQA